MPMIQSAPFSIFDDGKNLFDLNHGFLPAYDPISQLPPELQNWEILAAQLPKLLTSDFTRSAIENLPTFEVAKLKTQEQLERAMLILSYLGHAYVWNNATPITKIPKRLALPWFQVAKQIGRPPILSYASYALYNWQRIDINKPIQLGNIVLLQNFFGGLDEEWFILVHVEIEAKATAGITALLPAQQCVINKNIDELLHYLSEIVESINAMCDTLDRMPEHCDPYIYYNRVRPYIHGWKDNPVLPDGIIYEGVKEYGGKPQKFKGETGAQSSIIPSLDAAFHIEHEDNPLKTHLLEMHQYMPPQHRQFILKIENGVSIRDFVLKNFSNAPKLRDYYNEIIKLISRFRRTHLSYAIRYIQQQSQSSAGNPTNVGTGGTPYIDYLKKHIDETHRCII